MTTPEIIQASSVVINGGVLLVAIKLTWYLRGIDYRVNQMWSVFSRRYGTRTEGANDLFANGD